MCPGWDSNPHLTVFETAASAVGLPGRAGEATGTPPDAIGWFGQRVVTTIVPANWSQTAVRSGFEKMKIKLTMTITS